MAMTRKARRIRMIAFGGALLAAATLMMGYAFQNSIAFFFSPTELLAEERRPDRLLRLGGLVADGSVVRGESEEVRFDVTDGNATVSVRYTGVLPDLFREGQGVVTEGYYRQDGFEAFEVLAKHDENYVPKEVADALKEQGHWQEAGDEADTLAGGGS